MLLSITTAWVRAARHLVFNVLDVLYFIENALVYASVKVNPDPPPHPGTCGALVGLYHHISSSLSPQYVGDLRVLSLLS